MTMTSTLTSSPPDLLSPPSREGGGVRQERPWERPSWRRSGAPSPRSLPCPAPFPTLPHPHTVSELNCFSGSVEAISRKELSVTCLWSACSPECIPESSFSSRFPIKISAEAAYYGPPMFSLAFRNRWPLACFFFQILLPSLETGPSAWNLFFLTGAHMGSC